jgi:hypothetical protein
VSASSSLHAAAPVNITANPKILSLLMALALSPMLEELGVWAEN